MPSIIPTIEKMNGRIITRIAKGKRKKNSTVRMHAIGMQKREQQIVMVPALFKPRMNL